MYICTMFLHSILNKSIHPSIAVLSVVFFCSMVEWTKRTSKQVYEWVITTKYNTADDVYFYMFLCDMGCVLVIIIGYNNFVQPVRYWK